MSKIPVLVIPQRLEGLADILSDQYLVHRWWMIDDKDSFFANVAPGVRCIVGGGVTFPKPDVLAKFNSLGLLACISVGYESIDIDWCRRHGIEVSAGTGANARDVAEYAVALTLAQWCRIVPNDATVREGRWQVTSLPQRRALHGRTIGIVGMGAIGREIAIRFEPFGIDIRWWGPRPNPAAAYAMADSLLGLAEASDVLIVACRADQSNRGLIDREVIAALGAHGLLVNISRGLVVDENAVRGALRNGTLGGFAADVFEEEPTAPEIWTGVPGTLLSPHVAAATEEGRDALQDKLLENMHRFFSGQPLLGTVT